MNYENDQYLWDKTGEPDALVAGLERELAAFAMTRREAPAARVEARPKASEWRVGWGAVAAAVVVVAGSAWVARVSGPVVWPGSGAGGGAQKQKVAVWTVWKSSQGGGKQALTVRGGERVTVAAGEYVAAEVGEAWVTLTGDGVGGGAGGGAMVLGVEAGRVVLESGKAQAMGSARVAASGVEAVGGKFTVEVGAGSTAMLRVEDGVAVVRGAKRFARVPAGFESRVEKGEPGLPLRPDAGKGMAYAVTMLEDVRGGMKGMFVIVDQARREDAATLWNAAWRREDEMRKVVLTKLDELVPAPDRRVLEVWSEEGMELWWRKIVGNGQ